MTVPVSVAASWSYAFRKDSGHQLEWTQNNSCVFILYPMPTKTVTSLERFMQWQLLHRIASPVLYCHCLFLRSEKSKGLILGSRFSITVYRFVVKVLISGIRRHSATINSRGFYSIASEWARSDKQELCSASGFEGAKWENCPAFLVAAEFQCAISHGTQNLLRRNIYP